MEASRCTLLGLPVELRLAIYSFALSTPPSYTISTAKLLGRPADVVYQLYGEGRSPVADIPIGHVPIISPNHSPLLLIYDPPYSVDANSSVGDSDSDLQLPFPEQTLPSLHLACKTFHVELCAHFRNHTPDLSDLYVSFPHGLHILTTQVPHLLRTARRIHLAGAFEPRADANAEMLGGGPYQFNGCKQLAKLVEHCLGPEPLYPQLETLGLRIYYPGAESYRAVWADEESPISLALANVYGGQIDLEVLRGDRGTGIAMSVGRGRTDGRRQLSTVWKKLKEGGAGMAKCGTFVVKEEWEKWEARESADGVDQGGYLSRAMLLS